jgi:hypothetical protein
MLGRHIRDVRLTTVDFFDPVWIQVKTRDGKASLREHHGLWQADVAQADDANASRAVKDLLL